MKEDKTKSEKEDSTEAIDLVTQKTARVIFDEIERMTHFCGNLLTHKIPEECASDKNLLVEELKKKFEDVK